MTEDERIEDERLLREARKQAREQTDRQVAEIRKKAKLMTKEKAAQYLRDGEPLPQADPCHKVVQPVHPDKIAEDTLWWKTPWYFAIKPVKWLQEKLAYWRKSSPSIKAGYLQKIPNQKPTVLIARPVF